RAFLRYISAVLPALGEVDVEQTTVDDLVARAPVTVHRVSDVDSATVGAARAALGHDGSIGVIAADAAVPRLAAALAAAGIATATPDDLDAAARVTVVPASLAKGLEYDHVIVVEPAEIVSAEPRGLHRLYVVLTRAVSRLAVLHARPLLPALLG